MLRVGTLRSSNNGKVSLPPAWLDTLARALLRTIARTKN